MTKQTKDGWIRHRGGKCPVDDGVMIDVRHRDGDLFEMCVTGVSRGCNDWSHDGSVGDIMAYRVCGPVIEPAVVANVEAFNAQAGMAGPYIVVNDFPFQQAIEHGPLQWRDRIAQIDADIKAEEERHSSNMACMDQERADLVAKLAAEGFALIAPVVEPAEDMSDWRNWKAGDLIECVSFGCEWTRKSSCEIGNIYTVDEISEDENHGLHIYVGGMYTMPSDFKWHSRPTN